MLGYRAGWITATLLITALLSPSAEAVNWTKRYISLANTQFPLFRSLDIMVLPDGTPVVAHSSSGSLTFSFVDGQTIDQVVVSGAGFTSSKTDQYGIISFAKIGVGFGTDHGQRASFDFSFRPEWWNLGSQNGELILDSRGIPTSVTRPTNLNGQYFISSFDTPSAKWQTRTISSSIDSPLLIGPVATFTSDDRLVVASSTENEFELLVGQADGSFLTLTTDTNGSSIFFAASVAASPINNDVAFAFRSGTDLTVGVYDGQSVSYESIATDFGTSNPIAPGGLAYAPNGTLGLTYVNGTKGDVIYTTRIAPNAWTDEVLPIEGEFATLAYDNLSNPFVAVAGDSRIELLSPVLTPPLPGDYDGDGEVGQSDLDLVLGNWGAIVADGESPDRMYWVNDQGITASLIGQDELALVLQNWGSIASPSVSTIADATGLSESQIESLVPEPTSLTLLIIGGGLMLRRRRHGSRLAGDACVA